MRAAVIERFGGPEVLHEREMPVPEIGPKEILIAVHTAGVGSWDADMRGGWWPEGRPTFPVILGSDGSGTVANVGSAVRGFKQADAVYSYSFTNPKGGFYAEYVAVPASNVGHKPALLDMEQTGAIGTIGLTALQGVERLGIKKGDPIAIVGASGGVGHIAVQLAKWKGAKLLAIASGKDGVKLVNGLVGLDVAVDGKHDDVGAALSRFAPDGLAAVLAFAGGDPLNECVAQLRHGGRVVYPNGVEPQPKKRKGVEIISYDAEPGLEQFKALNAAIDEAHVKVHISARFPLAQASKAHERIESGHVIGKIVLRVRER
jgi:NADPH:quinone reductase-like Zn-dependent oxidoreductase